MANLKPLLETVGALLPRLKTWHASPHDFDKFDISKLRSGQGAAAYGEGIYTAESPAVSGRGGQYWNEFLNRFEGPEFEAAKALKANDFNREQTIKEMETLLDRIKVNEASSTPNRAMVELKPLFEKRLEVLRSGNPVGPRVYETAISAKPSQMLDWDAPLNKQPAGDVWGRLDKNLRDQIDDALDVRGVNAMSDVPEEYTGKDLYKMLNNYDVEVPIVKPGGDMQEPSRQVMDYLNAIDLPVTRYLDEKSRHLPHAIEDARRRSIVRPNQAPFTGDNSDQAALSAARLKELEATPQTRNYVTRDTNYLEILRKLAIPGLIGGGAWSAYKPQGGT